MSSTDTLFSEASSTVDPRVQAALRRLERAVAGEQVPPAMTDLDKTADWYAAHLREQIRDYLTLAAEDLLARADKGIHVRNVPAAPPTDRGEKPKIVKWSDGPSASITFEKAP
ncbi:MAG: hypothetical protein WC277_04985 [Bacilli bacterium]